jgi:hypothetical protein
MRPELLSVVRGELCTRQEPEDTRRHASCLPGLHFHPEDGSEMNVALSLQARTRFSLRVLHLRIFTHVEFYRKVYIFMLVLAITIVYMHDITPSTLVILKNY